MKKEAIKVGMVVYDKQTREYLKVDGLAHWALQGEPRLLKTLRPLTAREKGESQ